MTQSESELISNLDAVWTYQHNYYTDNFQEPVSDQNTDKYLNLDDDRREVSCIGQPVTHKIKKVPAQRDYKKNICRNMLRQAIKSMKRGQQLIFLQSLIADEQELNEFVEYFHQQLDSITGFRTLKQYLIILDQDVNANKKYQFSKYIIWFINCRGTLFILNGESNNVKEYIRYKNEIMMYYTQIPTEWCSNEPIWKQKIGH